MLLQRPSTNRTIRKNKEDISKALQRWLKYIQAWQALNEEGKEQLEAVAQILLYLR
jgi:hypothetical protein